MHKYLELSFLCRKMSINSEIPVRETPFSKLKAKKKIKNSTTCLVLGVILFGKALSYFMDIFLNILNIFHHSKSHEGTISGLFSEML